MQNNSVWSIKEIITILKIKFQNFISRKQMTPSEPRKKVELETKKNIILLDQYISHLTTILNDESITDQEKSIGNDLLEDIKIMNEFDILNNNISRIAMVPKQLLDVSDFSVMISKETILLAKEIHHFILTIKEEVK